MITSLPEHLPDTFTYGQALSAGLTRHRLYALRDAGDLDAIGRGLFRRAAANLADHDLIEAAHRAPRAWHPHLAAPITWHSFDRATFGIGRTTVAVDDETTVGLYDAPRTIVDTYRLRNALGSETAHEALRRWLRAGGEPGTLLATAESFPHARTAIRAALEVLL